MDPKTLKARARTKLRAQKKRRQDPRFVRTMGKLIHMGLLTSNDPLLTPYPGKIRLEDALWAGELEPRILELIPALVLKKPSTFRSAMGMPEDLLQVVRDVRNDIACTAFRGMQPQSYLRWVPHIGRKDRYPSVMKSYRWQKEDLMLLRSLEKAIGADSQVDLIRHSLRALQASITSD